LAKTICAYQVLSDAKKRFSTVQMSLRGGLCRSNLLFIGYFNSKGDCHAAENQERRLATISIYEMYGREFTNKNIPV
jgi:hypothetical protein